MPDNPDIIQLNEEQLAMIRVNLLADAIEAVRAAVRDAQADFSEQRWYRIVDTLATLIGPKETYALLRLASERRGPGGSPGGS